MLSKEQLEQFREAASERLGGGMLKSEQRQLLEHVQYLELQLRAANAFLQAETKRADAAESRIASIEKLAQCVTVKNYLALSDDEKAQCFAVMIKQDRAQIDMIKHLEERADANERDAERYAAIRNANMDERNRLEHYAANALDAAIDTAMAPSHATIQSLSTKE